VNPRIVFPLHREIRRGDAERSKSSRPESQIAETWYYVSGEGGHVGPLDRQQLKQTLATMEDHADVLVWCDKFSDWKRLRDVPELSQDTAALSVLHTPTPLETKAKNLFLQKPKWWLFTLNSLLSLATSRRAREEMRRPSAVRLIEKEVKRWLSEGPPEIVVSLGRAARANRVFVLVTFACLAYGVYDGLLMHSLASGLIVGILLAALLNLATFAARKYRVKSPTPLLIWIGNIAFWIGWALASYGIFLMVQQISHAGLWAAGSLLPSVIFYPAVGCSIRYMLGR
jgi:GYF domain 2